MTSKIWSHAQPLLTLITWLIHDFETLITWVIHEPNSIIALLTHSPDIIIKWLTQDFNAMIWSQFTNWLTHTRDMCKTLTSLIPYFIVQDLFFICVDFNIFLYITPLLFFVVIWYYLSMICVLYLVGKRNYKLVFVVHN